MSEDLSLGELSANALTLALYDATMDAIKAGSLDESAAAVAFLDQVKREVADLLEQAKAALIENMGTAPEVVSHGITFEKKVGAARKTWDHKSLGEIVARRIVDLNVDMETGEVLASPYDMVKQVLDYTGVSYWRVGELKNIGINADAYCEVGEPKSNIIIRFAK